MIARYTIFEADLTPSPGSGATSGKGSIADERRDRPKRPVMANSSPKENPHGMLACGFRKRRFFT